MSASVFYAWQRDRDDRVCRYFIREAAKLAIKRLKAEARVSVKSAPPVDLDEATKGVAGGAELHPARAILWDTRSFRGLANDVVHIDPATLDASINGESVAAIAEAMRIAFNIVWREPACRSIRVSTATGNTNPSDRLTAAVREHSLS